MSEAIAALEKQAPLRPCTLSTGLSHAAMDLCLDHGPKGFTWLRGSVVWMCGCVAVWLCIYWVMWLCGCATVRLLGYVVV